MTKKDKVLKWLEKGRTLTQMQAWDMWQYSRLAAGVFQLRKEGYVIDSKSITRNGATFAQYKLINK